MAFHFKDPDCRSWISVSSDGKEINETGNGEGESWAGQTVPLDYSVAYFHAMHDITSLNIV